ncbi:MAG: polyprenyl synthetase family protein [Anaerolineales bacterium]
MTSTDRVGELRSEMLSALEVYLRGSISPLMSPPQSEMGQMVSFHFGWSDGDSGAAGKRIRPLLTTLTCSAAGGPWRAALPAAAAVELVHNFSLIHDDIEDGSHTRRGRPTLWTRWSLPQALNTGDALLILSQSTAHALSEEGVPAQTILSVLDALNAACLQLTIGQHLDLAFEQRPDVSLENYLTMIQGKTASLLTAACTTGALIAGVEPARISAYRAFGHHLGMAFQIQDDILGIWGVPDKTGKPAGDDLVAHKKTLPVLLGVASSATFRERWQERKPTAAALEAMRDALEEVGALDHTRKLAKEHTESALTSLAEAAPEGEAAGELRRLAEGLLRRDS